MIDVGSGGSSGGVSSSELAGLLAGYATESWVDEHYISIDFFSRLFQAHGTENGSEIDVMPNDLETTITSVESMFGFWTNLYISALGSNGAAPAGISLGMLTDVVISGTPSAGQVLTFDAVSGKWVNGNGGASSLSTLTDVTLTSLQTNQILIYDATTQKWVNSSVKTINGYSIFGTGDIPASGGGGGNYVPIAGGVMTGNLGVKSSTSGQINLGYSSMTWGGWAAAYPLLYTTFTSSNDVLSMIAMPHIPYLKSGNRGYSGSADGAIVRFEGDISSSYYWDIISKDGGFSLTNGSGTVSFGMNIYKQVVVTCNNKWINNAHLCLTRLDENAFSYMAVIGVTDGNLHVDAYNNKDLYLNYYAGRRGLIVRSSGITEAVYIGSGWSNRIAAGAESRVFIGEYPGLLQPGLYSHNAAYTEWAPLGISGTFIQFYLSGNYCGVWNTTGLGISTNTPSYKLHVNGTIYATGSITALSDARKKDITGETGVTVEQIAHAPAVQFLWKDEERRKDGQQVGTLAQYWQTVLPEVVSDKGGELSMQYGVAALVSAIITARKVVDHERRIQELEKENERLKEEISQLRLN